MEIIYMGKRFKGERREFFEDNLIFEGQYSKIVKIMEENMIIIDQYFKEII